MRGSTLDFWFKWWPTWSYHNLLWVKITHVSSLFYRIAFTHSLQHFCWNRFFLCKVLFPDSIYLAHVRSILEYSSPMWSPNHVKDIIKLERVQRQASNFILNDYVSPYHERCTALSILPLCFCREIIDLCSSYSYLHCKLSCDYSSNFELACPHNGPRSAQQNVLFKLPLCKTVQFQCTYFYRSARLWNTLHFVIRDASSLQTFKKNLSELYLAMVNLFDVNNRCTWSLACACVNCRI